MAAVAAPPVEPAEISAPVEVSGPIDPRRLGVQIEAKLVEWQLAYTYNAKLPLRDLRVADWIQVRESEHIADRDSLAEFIVQMREGAVYPPIVVMHPNTLVDGNHRLSAAKTLRLAGLPAYIVQFPTVDMAKAFAAAMNQLNGRRLTNDEAFQSALTMFAMGLDDQAVAREVGRTQDAVRQMRRRNEFDVRVKRLGLAEKANLIAPTQQAKLAQISHDPVFAKAVEIAGAARIPAKTVSQIVKDAESATSDADAIDALEKIRSELAAAGPPPTRVVVPQAVKQARLHLGGLLKYEENAIEVLDLVDDQHRHDAINKWQRPGRYDPLRPRGVRHVNGINLEGADRITVGTSDTTMRIWMLLERAGEQGLLKDEIHALAEPHVNAGFARRRYLKQRRRDAQKRFVSRGAHKTEPNWETTDVDSGRRYVVTATLKDMRHCGSAILGADGRYRAGRQPRFQRDLSIIDLDGDRTRLHMNSANALRILEPAAARVRRSSRAQLNRQEKEAFLKLVELHKELLQQRRNGGST